MRKIIDKKVYDTETATFIGGYEFGNCTDFRYLMENLYRTKNGNWFLYYRGGAMTQYAVKDGNMTSGSDGVTVLDEEEALDWLEERGETEAIEQYFSDILEEA